MSCRGAARRFPRRRRTWPRPCAPPALSSPANKIPSREPATFFITVFGPSSRSGDWSPRLSPCSALLHSGIALHYSQTYPSFFSDPCMLVQESEGDRAEEAQLASTFGRCHETNSDNVITTRYCITAHTRRRTSCQIARQSLPVENCTRYRFRKSSCPPKKNGW